MKDIKIKIERKTSKVFPDGDILGISMENLQGNIICYFDEFVSGTAWLEIQIPDKTKGYLAMEKVGETYVLPIKSSLLKQAGLINMQLRITQGENIEEIPVYKSNIFYCKVKEAINSINEIPEEYPQWIDIANAKLNEIDNLDIDIEGSIVTITRKDGTTKSENVKGDKGDTGATGPQGEQGPAGYTPIKGTDYWNEEDKEEVKGFIEGDVAELESLLRNILLTIQEGGTTASTIEEIEQLIVSYFENKTVGEVEE